MFSLFIASNNTFLSPHPKKLFAQSHPVMDELQAGIKIADRNINNLRYADDTIPTAESEEELEPLDEGERGE